MGIKLDKSVMRAAQKSRDRRQMLNIGGDLIRSSPQIFGLIQDYQRRAAQSEASMNIARSEGLGEEVGRAYADDPSGLYAQVQAGQMANQRRGDALGAERRQRGYDVTDIETKQQNALELSNVKQIQNMTQQRLRNEGYANAAKIRAGARGETGRMVSFPGIEGEFAWKDLPADAKAEWLAQQGGGVGQAAADPKEIRQIVSQNLLRMNNIEKALEFDRQGWGEKMPPEERKALEREYEGLKQSLNQLKAKMGEASGYDPYLYDEQMDETDRDILEALKELGGG